MDLELCGNATAYFGPITSSQNIANRYSGSGEMSGTGKFPFRLLKIALFVTNYCLFGY